MIAVTEAYRVGPLTRQDAELIRNMQRKGRGGYWPEIIPQGDEWVVVMFGERDWREAKAILAKGDR